MNSFYLEFSARERIDGWHRAGEQERRARQLPATRRGHAAPEQKGAAMRARRSIAAAGAAVIIIILAVAGAAVAGAV